MNIESYDWDDLYKQAEEFIHMYIRQAFVNSGFKSFCNGHPLVEVSFSEKGNKAALKKLSEEKCFERFRGCNVNGSRICRGRIIFNADGSLYK